MLLWLRRLAHDLIGHPWLDVVVLPHGWACTSCSSDLGWVVHLVGGRIRVDYARWIPQTEGWTMQIADRPPAPIPSCPQCGDQKIWDEDRNDWVCPSGH